jgi:Fe-S-cluster containining protein
MADKRTKLDVADVTPAELPAGSFSSWVKRTRSAVVDKGTADVPCGSCIACCTSSYFIHVAPDETETLRHIPKALLFPAPGLPKGNVLMGYDEHGHCPMLKDGLCSIYEHRPKTCRNYDCRVFPAAGIESDGRDLINRQIRRWKFSYPTPVDRTEHVAVQTAAKFLSEHADQFPKGAVPTGATQLAILAIRVFEVFLDPATAARTDFEIVETIVAKMDEFESAGA